MIHRFVFHNDRLLPVTEVRLSPGQAGLERLGFVYHGADF